MFAPLATALRRPIGPPEQLRSSVKAQGNVQEAAKGIFSTFEYTRPEAKSLNRIFSAEIYSLVRMDRRVRIEFSIDTDDGEACARAVEMYLDQYWPDAEVAVKRIAGLQVDDPIAFRREGVVEKSDIA